MSTSPINPTEATTATELSPDPAPSTLHAAPSETCDLPPVTCDLPEPGARNPVPGQRPQCRAICTDGTRCLNHTLKGLHLCNTHFQHRHPALADKDHISVPLLEDHASIQLVMTQIVHGLLSHRIEPARAKAAIWAAQVAAFTLPRPARLKGNEPHGEPVHRIGFDHEAMISLDPDPTDSATEAPAAPTGHRPQATGSVTCNLQPVTSNLNYLCHVPATTEEVWALQDRDDLGLNQPAPGHRYLDPYHPAPPPQPFPGWDVPPPPPPPPPPAHESGLPCDCPKCVRHEALVQEYIDKYNGRPRRKSASKSPDDPDFNPLCKSNKPDCLGPDSEFGCRSCKKLRVPLDLEAEPEDFEDTERRAPSAERRPEEPCALSPVPRDQVPPSPEPPAPGSSGVIPETQYSRSPNE